MAVVNVGTVITKAITKVAGASPRPSFVTWCNEIVKDILGQPRTWKFLDTPVSIAIVNNQIVIPATISEINSIQVGDVFFTRADQLSAQEAAAIDSVGVTVEDSAVKGYTLDATNTVTFHPALTGTGAVIGELDITADYADNADTIFPLVFENLFITGLRMHFYDTDKDGRFSKESTVYQMEMNKVKAWDNRRKALPKYSRHGYVRG